MKTIEQILEGVTAGGQWEAIIQSDNEFLAAPQHKNKVRLIAQLAGITSEETNFKYAARAARNFPALVKALQRCCAVLGEVDESWVIDTEKDARKVLAEALK